MNTLVASALEGDARAVEMLVTSVQDRIFTLAVKMLYHTGEAEDATQEILIKIFTRLGSFRQESSFYTWAMKIASNHLLTRQKKLSKRRFTFKSCEDMIVRDIPDPSPWAEQGMLVAEMRLLCVQGLFQCLDRHHRLAYILSRTLEVSGTEGSAILGISPVNFRKRVSRAGRQIQAFMSRNCELADAANPCKCRIQAGAALTHGMINPRGPEHLSALKAASCLEKMEKLSRKVALLRAHPDYAAPGVFIKKIRGMMNVQAFE